MVPLMYGESTTPKVSQDKLPEFELSTPVGGYSKGIIEMRIRLKNHPRVAIVKGN